MSIESVQGKQGGTCRLCSGTGYVPARRTGMTDKGNDKFDKSQFLSPTEQLDRVIACVNALDGRNPSALNEFIEAARAVLPLRELIQVRLPTMDECHQARLAFNRLDAALDKLEGR